MPEIVVFKRITVLETPRPPLESLFVKPGNDDLKPEIWPEADL